MGMPRFVAEMVRGCLAETDSEPPLGYWDWIAHSACVENLVAVNIQTPQCDEQVYLRRFDLAFWQRGN